MIGASSPDKALITETATKEYEGRRREQACIAGGQNYCGLQAVRQVRDEVHQGSNPPTSTLPVVSALANSDFMVEIEAIAVVE